MARRAMIIKAEKQPRFKVRGYHRCKLCGRPRGFMRKFQVCRICFRTLANKGMIPGVTKSSW
ncbi:MAG: type Z 30S ribosomal protein S14 [Bdellovibrionales bacterium]|nr:type Z 30S ribosomal protein S14 [Bdellovibrionales bacterium]